jgi:hypothetical protein
LNRRVIAGKSQITSQQCQRIFHLQYFPPAFSTVAIGVLKLRACQFLSSSLQYFSPALLPVAVASPYGVVEKGAPGMDARYNGAPATPEGGAEAAGHLEGASLSLS